MSLPTRECFCRWWKKCKLSNKTLANPSWAGWKTLLWARKHFLFPTATTWQGLCSHTQILSHRSHVQELFGLSEQNFSLQPSSSPECTSMCSIHIRILAGKQFPLGFPLRMHLKHYLQAGPKRPVDRGICRQHMCSFYLAWNSIEHLWVWGKEGGRRAEECLHFLSCH